MTVNSRRSAISPQDKFTSIALFRSWPRQAAVGHSECSFAQLVNGLRNGVSYICDLLKHRPIFV